MRPIGAIREFLGVAWCCVALLAVGSSRVAAAQSDHQYSSADIEAGSRLYANQCSLCHGPNGDLIAGIDLRHGVFRRSSTDEDIKGIITAGIPSAGMPAFTLQPAEISTLVAFIRAGFDLSTTVVKLGNATRGRELFEGRGGMCNLPSSEWHWPADGARFE